MRHFFLVPKMDKAASGEKLFELTCWKELSVDKLQTNVFDINNNKNQQGSEEISSTTLYKWKKGTEIHSRIQTMYFEEEVFQSKN